MSDFQWRWKVRGRQSNWHGVSSVRQEKGPLLNIWSNLKFRVYGSKWKHQSVISIIIIIIIIIIIVIMIIITIINLF